MSTTKRKISEQVLKIMKGATPSAPGSTDIREIFELVGQALNKLLKLEYYSALNNGGEVNAGNLMIATYPAITVEKVGTSFSKIMLPCMPVRLIKNQGLAEITKEGDLMGEFQFVPVPAGMWVFHKSMGITSDMLGQICYTNESTQVVFAEDITTTRKITKVRVKLVVADVTALEESAPLPIPADMEIDVIQMVLEMLGRPRLQDKVTDIGTETQLNGK